ncbi:MAG: phenylalanine--tRNA ligase subunit beta [Candidatus Moraniibacteriota bacterium]
MQFSYKWLRELSGTKRSPGKLAELLLTHAFEVESVSAYPHGLADIVIGKVLKVVKHPSADRLKVTTLETVKGEARTIVCGASNVAAGQKVAVVLPGGKLPDGTVIKEAELRGVKSEGMICSERELGLGESHAGIIVLDKDAPLGKSFAKYVGLEDTILDVKILPDRSCDALSYEGLSREIAALEGFAPLFLKEKKLRTKTKTSSKVPKVTLKSEKCDRYILALFQGVKIEESPLSLKVKLLTSGLRPINAIVDITNYLMLLTGQPLHAFDADAIGKKGIVVRNAKPHERLMLLDGKTITLSSEDLVIAGSERALALAGVMGGKHSAITEKTKNIVVEIARFDPVTIRKTRKRHNFLTDASSRFERGIDGERPGESLSQLLPLIQKTTTGEYRGSRDVNKVKAKTKKIILSIERLEKMLGSAVPLFEAVQFLALEGLSVKKVANKKELEVLVPVRRPDLRDEFDLVEEIGRMRGYDKIVALDPALPLEATPSHSGKRFERRAKSVLLGAGFDEVMTYSFYSEAMAKRTKLSFEEHVALENPMNPDQALLRFSLLPNLLSVAEKNLKHFESLHLFEWGSVFQNAKLAPVEKKKLGLLSYAKGVDGAKAFFLMKGKVEALLGHFGIQAVFEPMAQVPALFHPTRMASLIAQEKVLGYMGEIRPDIAKAYGLPRGVVMVELDGELLLGNKHEDIVAMPLQRFPHAYRDISLTGPKSLVYAQIKALLHEAGGLLLQGAELFDIYEEGDERSFAFHLAFGLPERTLTSSEMDQVFDTIVREAKEKLGMRLRLS